MLNIFNLSPVILNILKFPLLCVKTLPYEQFIIISGSEIIFNLIIEKNAFNNLMLNFQVKNKYFIKKNYTRIYVLSS